MLTLRPYQQEALQAVYEHLRTRDDNPCVVLPTGAGKTPLLAQICQDTVERWHGRILVLSHVKELLEQAARHLASFLPVNMVGIHSAGLGRRDTEHPVIIAGIQTVAEKAGELGGFDLIVIDEAHMLAESGEGRYRTFLRDAKIVNPNVRLVGLTATPFRLGSGVICKPENLLNHVCYEANVKELILQDWLCPLTTKRGTDTADLSRVAIMSTGEFSSDEMQAAFEAVVKPACEEILSLTASRKSVLVFAVGIDHAVMAGEALGGAVVTGKTSAVERAAAVDAFRRGELKYLVNVGVFTTGFDATNTDAVVLLRATMSPGLYCQMVGRGLRKHPGKTDCLILDYGDNAIRHGPIDRIQVVEKGKKKAINDVQGKTCPNCREVIACQYRVCPVCGFEFPADPTPRHNQMAGDAPILSEEVEVIEQRVIKTIYSEYVKKKPDGDSVTLRVQYVLNEFMNESVSEFICFGHASEFARKRAVEWWRLRSEAPVPTTVMDALTLIRKGALADTRALTLIYRSGQKYPEILSHDIGDLPHWEFQEETDDEFFGNVPSLIEAEEVPF